tara:strand:- start:24 stop:575 length:552 start_codon:yes stop_codon:yes gene_type:complete
MTQTKTDSGSGCGVETAGIVFGGTGSDTNSQEFDGTSWTNGGVLNTGRDSVGRGGVTVPATLCSGGNPPVSTALCESYNGTAWTEVNNITTGRHKAAGGGPAAGGALLMGGTPGYMTSVESWDGTSWTAAAVLATGRYGSGAGSNSPGTTNIVFGGDLPGSPGFSNATEEWTIPNETKTFTAS